MKNSGMMKPPRHSDESVTDVPASLATAASSEERDGPAVVGEDLVDLRLAERERVRRREPERGEEQAADDRAELGPQPARTRRAARC